MTLSLLLVLVGEPHRTLIVWCDAASACSCDKDSIDETAAMTGLSEVTYGLRAWPSRALQRTAISNLQSRCRAACDATP